MKNITDAREIWLKEKKEYEKFGRKVQGAVLRILKKNGISAKVSYRVKDTDSLIKKIARKESTYDSIHDKVGVRIVTYFRDEMFLIDNLLNTHLKYEVAKREDMSDKLNDNEFGYQSIHYDICKKNAERELYCELQLRTICQDNWSELSHALAYKTEISLPQRIRREINALSAVFELADNQYQLIQSLISELPDTNPVKILNSIEKFYYTYLGASYDKELSGYFLKNIQVLYKTENPILKINEFINNYQDAVIRKINENSNNYYFTQPEIIIIFERLQNQMYDFTLYWEQLYPLDDLEEIANIWGVSIY